MRRRRSRRARGDLTHVCPFCRVYDPSHLVHHVGCPIRRPMALPEARPATLAGWLDSVVAPALVAGLYRRRKPRIEVMG